LILGTRLLERGAMSLAFSLSPSDQVIDRCLLQRFLKVNPTVSIITATQVPLDCAAPGGQFQNKRNNTPTIGDGYLTGNPVVRLQKVWPPDDRNNLLFLEL
jgi:hypothetical protein